MIIQCSKCQKKYKIDTEKVTEKGVKVTCQNCGNILLVRKRAEDAPPKDFTPCSVCGQPATLGLDGDQPMCDRCHDIEQGKAARFSSFSKEEKGPAIRDREIDLSSGGDVSFDSISGGDFAPTAYSTAALSGEGREYVSPDQLPSKSKAPGKAVSDFGSLSQELPENDRFLSPQQRSRDDQQTPKPPEPAATPPAEKKPAPPVQGQQARPVSTTPPLASPAPPKGAPARDLTPPPRQVPPGATPPPRQAPAQAAPRVPTGGVKVKDSTPPPSRPLPKPDRPFEKTPPDTSGTDKKGPTKAEAISLEPVDESVSAPASEAQLFEVTSLDAGQADTGTKKASIFPFILSILLTLALALYFFLKFADIGFP